MKSFILATVLTLWTVSVKDDKVEASYNADVDLTTPQVIRKYGYPAESHTVVTDDGYLLTLHRIPHGRKSVYNSTRTPVMLQHGLLASSSTWVTNGPEKSLAYILADLGYDVWLGNCRGNTYSRAHVTLSTDDPEFWNFSFHEMGVHDLPAEIDWILNITNHKKLFYVGHSMGTTMFYVLTTMRPEYNDKVQFMVSLAPVAFMGNVKSPIRLLAPFSRDIEYISHYLGTGEFLPHNKIIQWLEKVGCQLVTIEKQICEGLIFVVAGFDAQQFNMTLLPVILGQTPAGASTKTILHYTQEIQSRKFQQFDTGCRKDESGSEECKAVAEYDLSKITVPIALYYADNDWLASPPDVKHLASNLKGEVELIRIPFAKFNHIDFTWAIDVYDLVYKSVINNIKKHESNTNP
ncbi:Lipase 3 [Cryptotermes secundus]|uniref:Lipase n=1 Tax=Cryptotermes secundus TaxID=105785 RepID=A0A2J7QW21_9NEOP|nr:lipase 3 [Cryptotermes secundus]XP_023708442.1 lipase 3 [Cryptotermes secundus]PNF32785.1 Lipase 3 [Cryptotermes secundus]PNF32786.1 Lipase 3 [Cryptotermes secundus]PNF32787.1 Lipase 3 [Cryptotermes secundus]